MRNSSTPFLLAVVLVSALIFGCTRKSSIAVAAVAVSKSNQEAKRLFHAEPFKEEHGQWRTEGERQIWDALTSSGGHDFVAKVVFDEKGDVLSVDVRMLTHPTAEPATNINFLPGPDKLQQKQGIPEVMPK